MLSNSTITNISLALVIAINQVDIVSAHTIPEPFSIQTTARLGARLSDQAIGVIYGGLGLLLALFTLAVTVIQLKHSGWTWRRSQNEDREASSAVATIMQDSQNDSSLDRGVDPQHGHVQSLHSSQTTDRLTSVVLQEFRSDENIERQRSNEMSNDTSEPSSANAAADTDVSSRTVNPPFCT